MEQQVELWLKIILAVLLLGKEIKPRRPSKNDDQQVHKCILLPLDSPSPPWYARKIKRQRARKRDSNRRKSDLEVASFISHNVQNTTFTLNFEIKVRGHLNGND